MFNFKLQTILDVRKIMEEKFLQEFSQQQRECQKENERLQTIQQQKTALIEELRNVQGKSVNVSEITMNVEHIKQCIKKEAVQQEQVKEAERLTEVKKEALFEAIGKRKSMENLRARQFGQHQSDMNLIERTAIDEMAIVRHNRKKEE
jgi:flagellar export protein FliJ